MQFRIEAYDASRLEEVVRLSLRAWEPVFESLRGALEPAVFEHFYPEGWDASQRKAVEGVCAAEDIRVWVAVRHEGAAVGFVAVKLHAEERMGEVYMVAVDPGAQRHGIGSALMAFALDWMRDAGMSVALVETGGDPGHAPARRTYERLGFGLLPIARYFKKL
jgi:GNAT superfamily N-acetyltransferase